jgi:hypothetical protein
MFKIEYDIKIAEEDNYPYIQLADEYNEKPEDKFFVLELTKYLLHNLIESKRYDSDPVMNLEMLTTFNFIELLSEEVGKLIVAEMSLTGKINSAISAFYHFKVNTIKDLTSKSVYHSSGKIFIKKDGLLAFVDDEKTIYECRENEINVLSWNKQV